MSLSKKAKPENTLSTDFSFSASGKLMLFGEYLVLRGSRCLAFPVYKKQNLEITPYSEGEILWQCFEGDECWLEIRFSNDLEILSSTNLEQAEKIQKLLKFIREEAPKLQMNFRHFLFTLDFQRKFGWGTSSTLISLLSQWTNIDPYILLEKSFGGSAYDVAVAIEKTPIVYSIEKRVEQRVELSKAITDKLLFVYLGNKQDSSKEICSFSNKFVGEQQIQKMNKIIDIACQCKDIVDWENLIEESEEMLSSILNVPTVKDSTFTDYPYSIKSLGAWGGDFVMVTYRDIEEAKEYFKNKYFAHFFTYEELIKR